jgi:transposase-like protein
MNRYQVDGKSYLVIDGELWQLVAPAGEHPETAEVKGTPKRKYKKRINVERQPKKAKPLIPWTRSNRFRELTEAEKEQVLALAKDGQSAKDIAKTLGVGGLQIGQMLRRSREKGELDGDVKPPEQQQIAELKQVKKGPLFASGDWTPTLERQMYRCENGHQFKSNLPIDRVMCPYCKSRNVEISTEPPVHEEEVDA